MTCLPKYATATMDMPNGVYYAAGSPEKGLIPGALVKMYTNARKKVEEILAAPIQDPLSESATQQLDEILQKANREIKE